jgi:hypothetical protein
MLDLETFGTTPGSVIRSIGAVVFDIESGELGNEFYSNIDRESCEGLGMTVDPETVKWWDRQSKEAQVSLMKDQRDFTSVGADFCRWYARQCRGLNKVAMWSQGSNFDGVLLEAALRMAGHRPPWKFYHAFDTRTAYFMGAFDSFSVKRSGTYHNALDDAKHQARCVHRAYVKLRKGGML